MDLHKELTRLHKQLSTHMVKTNMIRNYKPIISLDSVNHDVDKGRFGEVYRNGYFVVDNFLQPHTLTQLNNFILTNEFEYATTIGAHHLDVEFCDLIYEDIQSVYRELEEYKVHKSYFTFFGYKDDVQIHPNFYDGIKLEIWFTPEMFCIDSSEGGTHIFTECDYKLNDVAKNPFFQGVDVDDSVTIKNIKVIPYVYNRAVFINKKVSFTGKNMFQPEIYKKKASLTFLLKKST
jgi:hypothetical protein